MGETRARPQGAHSLHATDPETSRSNETANEARKISAEAGGLAALPTSQLCDPGKSPWPSPGNGGDAGAHLGRRK